MYSDAGFDNHVRHFYINFTPDRKRY